MKKFIREWGIVALVGIFLGLMVIPAISAPRDGNLKISVNVGTQFEFDAMASPSNTTGICNPNGMTEQIIVSFVNSGPNVVDMWLQDGDTTTGPWSNAIANVMTVNPANSPTLRHRGGFAIGPCFRLHSADTDVDATNTITPTLKTWR